MRWVIYHSRLIDTKNDIKNCQGPTTSPENATRKYLNFTILVFKFQRGYDLNLCRYLNPELPPMRDFAALYEYFLNRHTFVCGTLFPGIPGKAQFALFPETKFQKCNTCRYLEKLSRTIKCLIILQ